MNTFNRRSDVDKFSNAGLLVELFQNTEIFEVFTPEEIMQIINLSTKHSFDLNKVLHAARNGLFAKRFREMTLDDVKEAVDLLAVRQVHQS